LPSQWSGWTVASWFAAPNAQLDGCCPADMVDSDVESVIRAALSLDSVDAYAFPHLEKVHEFAAHL